MNGLAELNDHTMAFYLSEKLLLLLLLLDKFICVFQANAKP